jgi:hypothetical protein
MGIPTVSFLICLLGFLREKTTDLPGVKQPNRRDIQEEILSFNPVVFS